MSASDSCFLIHWKLPYTSHIIVLVIESFSESSAGSGSQNDLGSTLCSDAYQTNTLTSLRLSLFTYKAGIIFVQWLLQDQFRPSAPVMPGTEYVLNKWQGLSASPPSAHHSLPHWHLMTSCSQFLTASSTV